MSDTQSQQPPEQGIDSGRREFVKKAAYSAPVLVALGFAAHSKQAFGQFPPPPSAPNSTGTNAKEPSEEELLLQELEDKD